MTTEHELPADLDNYIAGLRIENINLKLAAKQADALLHEAASALPIPHEHLDLAGRIAAHIASQQGEQATAAENAQVYPEQAEVAQGAAINYANLYEYACSVGVDYNNLCAAVRAALAQPSPIINYALLHAYACENSIDYNVLCAAVRDSLAQPSPFRYCHNAGSTAVNPGAPLPGCVSAQPSPAPELDAIAQGMKPLPAEFAKVIEDNLPELLIKSEQAPELERPEVVGWYRWSPIDTFPGTPCKHIGFNEWAPSELLRYYWAPRAYTVRQEPLMTVAQHDRIVGELQKEASGWKAMSIVAANGKDELRHQLEAAQARVAELQEQIEWFKNPKALAATIHSDVEEAVRLQRLLMERFTDFRPPRDGLMGWAHAALSIPVAQAGQVKNWTYASEQETNCAGCGVRKHTPLRVDWMGGYVCLTCIDQKLEELYEALPDAQAGQVPDFLTVDDMKWLRRFAECCEDSDAGGHDLPRGVVEQLVRAGALRHCGGGITETTAFGDWLLDAAPARGGSTDE